MKKNFWKTPWAYAIIFLAIVVTINALTLNSVLGGSVSEVEYSEFLEMVDAGLVEEAQISDTTIAFTTKQQTAQRLPNHYVTYKLEDNQSLVDRLSAANVTFTGVVESEGLSFWEILVGIVLPVAFYGVMIFWIVKLIRSAKNGGGVGGFGFGKSSAKCYDIRGTNEIKTCFADVAGQDEAKEQLVELVDFLHRPERYTELGAKLPKGALLVGPPGTGKTLLAKAVAGEAKVPFFFVSGSAFVEMFVGTGAARVRDLFKQAQEKAPCIIFIDEIDAIGKKRDSIGIGGNDEREQTLNQLLAEMDGFDPAKGIIVLGATNRPEILDKALLRPGRFDRRITVDLPDVNGREQILRVHAKDKVMDSNVDLKAIARATVGASGADLANILNEAALGAVRENRKAIVQSDLDAAVELVIAGSERKSMVISQQEKRIIAFHEIGHALVAAKQKNSAPVQKITIIPRTSGALGYTMQVDEEDRVLMTQEDLENQLAVLTAGRAAEQFVFGTCTTGASNDIERATKLARSMVARFGMSEKFGMMALDTAVNPYLGDETQSICSQDTAAQVDQEVQALIRKAYDAAMTILRENAQKLNELAGYLLERENITGAEFMDILNSGPSLLTE